MLTGLCLTGLMSACSGTQTAQPAGAGLYSNASAPTVSAPPPAGASPGQVTGVGAATVVTVHGKIVSVDRPNKLVTLEGPGAKKITIRVDNPYNLAAAQPGVPFVARFYEIATIREKQPGESIPSASLQAGIISASPGQIPGAAVGKQVQLVVIIDAINRDKNTVAIKGPDGVVETVAVANPANLANVNVGDQIVITLTKVVTIALEKEPGA
jgi:hypothetical protein